jgi:hypothetical protein
MLASDTTTPRFGGSYALSSGRVFFIDSGSVDSSKNGGHLWSIAKAGGDAKQETDVDVVAFQILGDTVVAAPASHTSVMLLDRSTGAKKTVVPDPEKNECVGDVFWRVNDEAITSCVLPQRTFHGPQNAVIAIRADGTMRCVYRADCSSCTGLRDFRAVDGIATWVDREWGDGTLSLLQTKNDDATAADVRNIGISLGGSPSQPDAYRASASYALDGKYLVYQMFDGALSPPSLGLGAEISLQETDRSVRELTRPFGFAWLDKVFPISFPTVLATDERATYFSSCRPPLICNGESEGKSLIILPWGPITPDDRGSLKVTTTPYYVVGGDARLARDVVADERYLFWVEAGFAHPAKLWRGPL